jgi:anti-sigma factor RsiW
VARLRRLCCREVVELVTDELEGALAARTRARFQRHLARCPGCAAYLQQMRDVVRILARLGAAEEVFVRKGHWTGSRPVE